jgi:predicted kinase
MELVILIGLPAAGKSTFAQQYFAATHDYVSKDRLRRNGRPGRRQARLLDAALQAGRSVVVDNTNATIEERSTLICLGQAYRAHIARYYFPSAVSDALDRNRARTGMARVPAVAIYATRKKLVPPNYAEGFAALYAVRIGAGGAFEVRSWQEEKAEHGQPRV